MGFRTIRNRPGRAKAGSTLTDFYYELAPLPLFHSLIEPCDTSHVAVDANVFFDLIDCERPHYRESAGLLADWCLSEIELCVTAAIHEDIARAPDPSGPASALQSWTEVRASRDAYACIDEQLADLIGRGETAQDRSDRSHLSHAIAENLSAFITRDEFLLEKAESIYSRFGICICRPSQFITDLDLIVNQDRFDRHDLTSIQMSIVAVRDESSIPNLHEFRRGEERERVLRNQIRTWLANPQDAEIRTVVSDRTPQCLVVTNRCGSVINIERLRCRQAISNQRRGRTLTRFLTASVRSPSSESCVLLVTDTAGAVEYAAAFCEAGFVHTSAGLIKLSLPGVWPPEDAIAEIRRLSELASLPPDAIGWFERAFDSLNDAQSYLALEHAIWPGKLITHGVVENLVVPIQARWARPLFDSRLGSEQREIWPDNADLLLNPVSAYYSGAQIGLQHGRILWYVSESATYSGTKCVRACSQMTERVTGPPLNLYRRFRHFGVYDFRDVEEVVSSSGRNITAMEFGDTELFCRPIRLDRVREILGNPRQSFQWPLRIGESEFFEVYQRGQEQV